MKKTLYILIILLLSVNIIAQDKKLNSYRSVAVSNKTITLLPGFKTEGKTFHAYINKEHYEAKNLSVSADASQTTISSTNMNYKVEIMPKFETSSVLIPSILNSFDYRKYSGVLTYMDGLGRDVQTIALGAGPLGEDVVTFKEYDSFGREVKEYLPYIAFTDGKYDPDVKNKQKEYYKKQYGENYAYAQKVYDGSPLNRVVEQGAPGADWQPGNYTVKSDYKVYTSTRSKYTVSASGTITKGVYAANKLLVEEVEEKISETQTSVVRSYKDSQGRVVEKEVVKTSNEKLSTYYVYDEWGQLACVIPPKAEGDHNKTELCYYYKYDNLGRLVEKKIPGKEWEYLVYDKRDNLVATQDGVLRKNNNWLYTRYDKMSRVVETGTLNFDLKLYSEEKLPRISMQEIVNGLTEMYEVRTGSSYTSRAFPFFYVDDNVNMISYNPTINKQSTTYYDDYNFVQNSDLSYKDVTGFTGGKSNKTNTLVTGSKVKNLESGNEYYTVTYYDDKQRTIQTITQNHLGGTDLITNAYDFTNKVIKTQHNHSTTGFSDITLKTFVYDHRGEIKKVKLKYNTNPEITITENEYNDLGQLAKTSFHNGIEQLKYSYNIRGWMTKVNSVKNSSRFNFELFYNNGGLSGQTNYFNGNISAMRWKTEHAPLSAYTYKYDRLNQLNAANYSGTGNYTVNNLSYDKNGNILTLDRFGKYQTGAYGAIDKLSYKYGENDNILRFVNDDAKNVTNEIGFIDKEKGDETTTDASLFEYQYNENGNLWKDKNKGIKSIDYNILNLPKEVSFLNKSIKYQYDASGNKLKKTWNDGAERNIDYVGNHIYMDGKLAYILTDNGRMIFQKDDNQLTNPQYEYNIKDHLGNVRVVFNHSGQTLQENSYYPFGLVQKSLSWQLNADEENKNRYLYNGKELQDSEFVDTNGDSYGLGWLDYGARMSDPALGRWHVVDPMAESYIGQSPYHFSGNNPIKFVDDNGMNYNPYFDKYGNYLGKDEFGFKGNIFITTQTAFNEFDVNQTKIVNSKDIRAHKDTRGFREGSISMKAEVRIANYVLGRMRNPRVTRLYNGSISMWEGDYEHVSGKTVRVGINDPAGYWRIGHNSMSDGTHKVTVFRGGVRDLQSVEAIQNYLGIHEYYGHGIKGFTGKMLKGGTHYMAYYYQWRHKTFKHLNKEQRREIIKRYFEYLLVEDPAKHIRQYKKYTKKIK